MSAAPPLLRGQHVPVLDLPPERISVAQVCRVDVPEQCTGANRAQSGGSRELRHVGAPVAEVNSTRGCAVQTRSRLVSPSVLYIVTVEAHYCTTDEALWWWPAKSTRRRKCQERSSCGQDVRNTRRDDVAFIRYTNGRVCALRPSGRGRRLGIRGHLRRSPQWRRIDSSSSCGNVPLFYSSHEL
jgi:hypothetical protein